jgi:uncharacterized protein (TIGR02145 family)
MQGFNPSTLTSVGSTTTLTDTRDNSIYRVRKLADGNVWMTEGLRITNKRITSRDSNIQSSSWQIPQNDKNAFTQSANSPGVYVDPNMRGIASGAFYTFYSATAGVGDSSANGRVTQDICPKGWRLPTKTEHETLYSYYNSLSALKDYQGPDYWLSGYAINQPTYNHSDFHPGQSKFGVYWSSLASSDGNAYVLYLDSERNNVEPALSMDRSYGFNIRCIADTNNQASQTMQTFNQNSLPNVGDYALLTDERDNNKYMVRRLADGRVWMTQNLKISGKTITSADSNMPSGSSFEIPSSTNSDFGFDAAGVYIDSDYGGYYNFYAATAGWGSNSVTSGNFL